jgi:two-component system, NtrC family, response regulator HydG
VEQVLAAEAAGALGILAEPPDREALLALIEPLLTEPGEIVVPEPGDGAGADDEDLVVGSDPALVEAYRTLARVAPSRASVLITGESGTGKELVAQALHRKSPRREKPFVAVNCAAIPENLLEAELFGYEKGAFTGAVGRSDGRFGRANGGTLFLDEIGEMPVALQAKLLRALESGEVERLGSPDPVRVDVRLVAATNLDLPDRVQAGEFREDLYWRLAVVGIELPALRERPGDVLSLALHFAARFALRYERPVRELSRLAAERLEAHPWPGNVRELRNVMDRAVLLARGGVIRSPDLRLGDQAPRSSPPGVHAAAGLPPTLSLKEVEALHIRRVLAHTGGHMGEAARILGVHRNTMTQKVRDHGIDPRNPVKG